MWPHYLLAASAPQPSSGLDPAWVVAALALATAVTGLIAWGSRWAWRILRQVSHFLDEWKGEPARDGMPARLGVMARLASVETLVAQVAAEVQPNHGQSLRDVVGRIETDVAAVKAEQARCRERER